MAATSLFARRRAALLVVPLLLVPLLALVGATPAGAITRAYVTTTEDVVDPNDGETSLREAVSELSGETVLAQIFLLPGAEHVLDRCGGADDTNEQGDVDLYLGASSVDVFGNGATVRQTCAGERVLDAITTSIIDVFDLTITGGDVSGVDADGGGLRIDGSIVGLDGVEVVGNRAAGSGGGVAAPGGVSVRSSTIADNVADGSGGGVWSAGLVATYWSTLSANVADGVGGAIASSGSIWPWDSTIAGNTASEGGGALDGATVVANRSTVVGNRSLDGQGGWSVAADGDFHLRSTVVDPQGHPTTDACSAAVTDAIAAYVTDSSCGLPAGDANVEDGADPQLGPLADNGRDTLTMAPSPGSPLRDVVPEGDDCFDGWVDQRGVRRPQGGACDVGAVETPLPFTDVGLDHPFFDEINLVLVEGITGGYPDGGYHPSDPVSRQAMAAFLYRLATEPEHEPGAQQFFDVPPEHPFFLEIDWLAETGITGGYPDGGYHPSDPVSRQAMAAFLHRLSDDDHEAGDQQFFDVPPEHPFFLEIDWLAETGITGGYPDGGFHPSSTVTRQAMAAFLARGLDASAF